MRITEHEKNAIIEAAKNADPDAKVWFFGSRIGEQKIDIVFSTEGKEAFFRMAVSKGILLYG